MRVLIKPNMDGCFVSAFRPNQLLLYMSLLAASMVLLRHSSAMITPLGQGFFIGRGSVRALFSISLSKQAIPSSLFKYTKRKRFFSVSSCTSYGDIHQERTPSAGASGNSTKEEKLLTRGIFCNTELSMKHITAVRLYSSCLIHRTFFFSCIYALALT